LLEDSPAYLAALSQDDQPSFLLNSAEAHDWQLQGLGSDEVAHRNARKISAAATGMQHSRCVSTEIKMHMCSVAQTKKHLRCSDTEAPRHINKLMLSTCCRHSLSLPLVLHTLLAAHASHCENSLPTTVHGTGCCSAQLKVLCTQASLIAWISKRLTRQHNSPQQLLHLPSTIAFAFSIFLIETE